VCDTDTDDRERLARDSEHLMVREVCHLVYFDQKNLEAAKKALRIPGPYQPLEVIIRLNNGDSYREQEKR